MIVGVGIDVVDIARFGATLERTPRLRPRLFTDDEQRLPLASLAARFAAKEALAKALGSPGGMRWLDCEVVKSADGAPRFAAYGSVAARIAALEIGRIHLSLSHDGGYVTAMVVCES